MNSSIQKRRPLPHRGGERPEADDDSNIAELQMQITPARTLVRTPLSNQDFIAAIFHGASTEHHTWVCGFNGVPDDRPGIWAGRRQKIGAPVALNSAQNTYFCVSELSGEQRRKDSFIRMAVLVGDDPELGTLGLPPSYVLQTSPGKYQVGYLLDRNDPETSDGGLCDAVLKAMVKSGLVDRSGNNVIRYVRLPQGRNEKPRDSGHFEHALIEWHPEKRYSLREAASAFGIAVGSIEASADGASRAGDKFDQAAAITSIVTGESIHDSVIRFAASYAAKGIAQDGVEALLRVAIQTSVADDDRKEARLRELPRAMASAYAKFCTDFDEADPVDLFGSIDAGAKWNPDDYPPVVAALAADIANRLGVDPLMPAWMMLTAAGALIHDSQKIQVKAHDTNWRESARLWVSYVADPSAKKSPTLAEVMRPVRSLQAAWWEHHQAQREAWKIAEQKAKKEKRTPPEPPRARRIIANDTTVEALAEILEANEGGILLEYDELTAWFGSMDAYRTSGVAKDRSVYLSAYNGGPVWIDRATKGSRHVPNFSASIIGGIQPEPMRKIASKLEDDGLLQRFICIPVRPSTCGTDRVPDQAAAEAWEALVSELPGIIGHGAYRLDAEAQSVMDETRARIHRLGQHPGFDSRLRTAIQKGEGQVARMALIYHFMTDRSEPDLIGGAAPSAIIPAETVRKAARAYLDLVIPSLCAFYTDLVGVGESLRNARLAAGYVLAQHCESVSERDLYRAHREFRGEGRRDLQSAMQQLELAGWVVAEPTQHGKPTTNWRVNPRVHALFRGKAEEEARRRLQVRESIQAAGAEVSRLSLAYAG